MIAVLAGNGQLPIDIYQALTQKKIPFVIVKCSRDAPLAHDVPFLDHYTQWGKVGAFIQFLRQHNVSQIVLAGSVSRPTSITDLKFDWQGLQWINFLRQAWDKGDDGLIRCVIELLEKEGFKIVSAHHFLTHAPIPQSEHKPQKGDLLSIDMGKKALTCLSPFDVGQAIAVAGEQILGIEGPEGTDALIQRCAAFVVKRRAILIKMAKVGQTLKADSPTLGPQTIENLAKGGFQGLAFEHKTTHLINPEVMFEKAHHHKIFIQPF